MRKAVLILLILAVVSLCLACPRMSLAGAKYSGGSGEPNNPYQIADVNDLLTLAEDTNDYNQCFILTADINLSSYSFTTAVIAPDTSGSYGYQGIPFTGIFDGAGHKIANLTIDTGEAGNDYLGLFGKIAPGGEIKNLGLENVSIAGRDYSECFGGLAGENRGTISNCYSTGAISGGEDLDYLGGLVGWNTGTISNCYSTGVVAGGDYSWEIGGLVGENYTGTISNCFSTCNVTGENDSDSIGGLVGYNSGTISNCCSTGNVTGGDNSFDLGGLVGDNLGSISSSYFLDTAGLNNDYGTPLTDEQMKQQSSFIGWDFVGEAANGYYDFWRLCNEGLEYPKLAWQYLPGDIVCPDGVDIYDLAALCDQWLFEEIPADLAPPPSGDGIVNFADFAIFANQWGVTNDIYALLDFAEQWLKIGLPVCSADISPSPDGDGRVNAADFAVMANDWLKGF